jgi:site-specific recombinase XerD
MTIRKRKDSDILWYRFTHEGEVYEGSTRTKKRLEARAFERRVRERVLAGEVPAVERGPKVDLQAVSELDLQRGARDGLATVTQQTTYRIHWKHIHRLLGEALHPRAVTPDLVDDYVLKRRAEKVTGQTIRKELQTLRRGLRLARRKGWVSEVFEDWPRLRSDPASKQRSGKRWPVETVVAWLKLLSPELREEMLFDLLTGLRDTELRNARFEWVRRAPEGSPTPAYLDVPPGAGKDKKNGRTIGLTREALAIVARRYQAGSSDGTIFGKLAHKFHYDKVRKALGLSMNITRRDLRHMFATLGLEETQDVKAIMSALGHNDLRTTARYLSSDLDRTARASVAVISRLSSEMGTKSGTVLGTVAENQPGDAAYAEITGLRRPTLYPAELIAL